MKPPAVKLYIGLGGNVGGEAAIRERFIAAREALGARESSSLWRSPPVDGTEQPDYLNAVVALYDCRAEPGELLAWIHAIEADHGRDRAREQRWGPRTLDLDVLRYSDDRTYAIDGLTVPHPRLAERRFVVEPLAELGAIERGALAGVRDQRCELVTRRW